MSEYVVSDLVLNVFKVYSVLIYAIVKISEREEKNNLQLASFKQKPSRPAARQG